MPPSEMQFSQQKDFQSELHTGPGTCLGHVEISGMSGNPYFTNWMSNPVLEIPGWEARQLLRFSKMSEPWSLQSGTDKEMQPVWFL